MTSTYVDVYNIYVKWTKVWPMSGIHWCRIDSFSFLGTHRIALYFLWGPSYRIVFFCGFFGDLSGVLCLGPFFWGRPVLLGSMAAKYKHYAIRWGGAFSFTSAVHGRILGFPRTVGRWKMPKKYYKFGTKSQSSYVLWMNIIISSNHNQSNESSRIVWVRIRFRAPTAHCKLQKEHWVIFKNV